MESNLAALPGDGVGPAVGTQVLTVVQAVGDKFGRGFNFSEDLGGGVAIDTLCKALSPEALYMIVDYAKGGLERQRMWHVPEPSRRGQ